MYIQMHLYESYTLKEWLDRENRVIDMQENIHILKQIVQGLNDSRMCADFCLQGLKYIHKEGICHRDLKPSNIFISQEGIIKVFAIFKCLEIKTLTDRGFRISYKLREDRRRGAFHTRIE